MSNTKYPFMVEFTGVAEAGKTTCIKNLLERFYNLGVKVHYIQESAEIVDKNIPRGSFESHLSMRLTTINEIIKCKYSDYDLILIDRGLIDGVLFTIHFLTSHPEAYENCSELISFINSLNALLQPDLLVIFKSSPDVSIQRRGGKEGHTVTHKFLEEQNKLIESFIKTICVPFYVLDTSNSSKEAVANEVFNLIIKLKDH